MNRLLIEFGAACVAALCIVVMWGQISSLRRERDDLKGQLEAAKESARIDHENMQKELDAAKHQPAVAAGVRRVCHQISMPVSPARGNDAAGTDAGARLAERLADDVIACQRNSIRLRSLQEWVKANGG